MTRRGVALAQALIIVAALAALALALVHRGERVVARLEGRFMTDQAGLYLDSGVDLLRDSLPRGIVHQSQDWARPREGVLIGEGELAWIIEDLQGRFNLQWIAGSDQMRQAFETLALAQGLRVDEVAEALRRMPRAERFAWFPADQFFVMNPVADPQAMARLARLIIALPADRRANINTLHPEVLAVMAPGLSEAVRDAILRRVATTPVRTLDDLLSWVRGALGDEVAAVLATLPLGTVSSSFGVRISVQLDTHRLVRSGILDTGDPTAERAVLRIVHPVSE